MRRILSVCLVDFVRPSVCLSVSCVSLATNAKLKKLKKLT